MIGCDRSNEAQLPSVVFGHPHFHRPCNRDLLIKESVEFTESRCIVHEKGRIDARSSSLQSRFVEPGKGGFMEECGIAQEICLSAQVQAV